MVSYINDSLLKMDKAMFLKNSLHTNPAIIKDLSVFYHFRQRAEFNLSSLSSVPKLCIELRNHLN